MGEVEERNIKSNCGRVVGQARECKLHVTANHGRFLKRAEHVRSSIL